MRCMSQGPDKPLRIEAIERPSVTIAYWIIGGVLVVAGLLTLRGIRRIESIADIPGAGENIIVAGMLFLMGGLCLYGAWATTRDRLRQGAIVLELQTPVAPGDRLRAKLIAGTGLRDTSDLEAELRCMHVEYVWREGTERGQSSASPEQKVLWRTQAHFALQRSASRSECDIAFELPQDALPTEGNASIFRLEPGRFWEMVVTLPNGKETLLRTYRIPVQAVSEAA